MREQYLLLLRGVNVGGKNRVVMPELRARVEALGFADVRTYIGSGNVLLAAREPQEAVRARLADMLREHYPFDIPFALIGAAAYRADMAALPDWWHGPMARRDALFYTEPADRDAAARIADGLTLAGESLHVGDTALYWGRAQAAKQTAFARKLLAHPLYKRVTIRNGNTAAQLLRLLDG